ncbi:histidinol-phosphate aminotransferase [Boletus edulis BED1]|uniref:histidinol-phosphate transaminase n=1 Tax=Boletus edulis BED1 TaxID=1328754 RepID=A0AAD4BMS2_BOLED|nr:histidinol-phosphate aminotransferase [Boletus edulis BED1]
MPILGLKPSSEPTKPAHFDIEKAIRPNILALHPYRCARDDYQEGILLDANENALGHSLEPSCQIPPELRDTLNAKLNRYPDPSHDEIKTRIATLRGLPSEKHVFLGVGSDEVIDLIMRVCVTPAREKILITPPTYGMYMVCAQVNDVGVVRCHLNLSGDEGEGGERGRFSLPVDSIKQVVSKDPLIKLIFLCSPGNPTGTTITLEAIRSLLEYEPFKGIVVVDEAYIDFAGQEASAVSLINDYANLCVMQTLSKSFGLAAIRLGIALAQPPLIPMPTAHLALAALQPAAIQGMRDKIRTLLASRDKLKASLESLADLGVGKSIGGNDANFLVIPIPGSKDRRAG